MLSRQISPVIFFCAFSRICPTLAQTYDCADKRCAAIASCAEAHYKLTVCGQSERDGDSDGIPCENVCGKTMEEYRARLKAEGVELGQSSLSAPKALEHDMVPDANLGASASPGVPLTCAGKHRCSEMASCEEARFYLTTCGVSSLDRDHDGMPCESLCGSR
jgi:hypothetical protein